MKKFENSFFNLTHVLRIYRYRDYGHPYTAILSDTFQLIFSVALARYICTSQYLAYSRLSIMNHSK